MLKYFLVLFALILLSSSVFAIEVTEQEIEQFIHRYLNNHFGKDDRHCHDGYCYFDTSRGNIDVYWRNYGDKQFERNTLDIRDNHNKIKIEADRAQTIVRDSLRKHLDLFDHLSEITTSPELLPYLEKYEALKMRFISKSFSPGLKIILIGDQHISPDLIGGGSGIGRCDFTEGIVLINANTWNSCIRYDDVFSEFLIFHEVAHCDLKRIHNDGYWSLTSFVDDRLIEHSLLQVINGPIESCGSIDSSGIFREIFTAMSNQVSLSENYVESNLERLYIELFSQNKFYDYDRSHYVNKTHDDYTEAEDLSEFTAIVDSDLIAIKQKLQRLARDQNL